MESRVCILLRPYLSLFILVPENEAARPEELKAMVTDINCSGTVREEEILSDNIYYYDAAKRELCMYAGGKIQREQAMANKNTNKRPGGR